MLQIEETLRQLCLAPGVSGDEQAAADTAARLLEPLGPVQRTPLGSLLCQVLPAREGRPHLLLDAHLDQIGMIVTRIDDEGFLRVGNCGGLDRRTLAAARVTVHGAQSLPGVVCSTPPHLSEPGERTVAKVDELVIDIGLDGEQAHRLVAPGDRITLDGPCRALPGGRMAGAALDDRAGCAAVIEAARLLRQGCPNYGVTVALTAMEEIGGQGAQAAAWGLAPTHAIVVDVSFAHTPDAPREKCGELGKGPMIGIAPLLCRPMWEGLMRTAQEKGIPYQTEVMGGHTGTNADSIVPSRTGVRAGMVSIPQRYMHTPVELVDLADVQHTAELIAAYGMGGFADA